MIYLKQKQETWMINHPGTAKFQVNNINYIPLNDRTCLHAQARCLTQKEIAAYRLGPFDIELKEAAKDMIIFEITNEKGEILIEINSITVKKLFAFSETLPNSELVSLFAESVIDTLAEEIIKSKHQNGKECVYTVQEIIDMAAKDFLNKHADKVLEYSANQMPATNNLQRRR